MKAIILAILLLLALPSSSMGAGCTNKGIVQDCPFLLDWQWTGDPTKATGFLAQRQNSSGGWLNVITNIPISSRQAVELIVNDPGGIEYCYRMFAYYQDVMSESSNTACATSPIINIVTMKTQAIVTTSHRSGDTSSIIAVLVNQNTVIGSGGLELTYPVGFTLTVSRRATNTSSVIAILVNKSTNVLINP